MKTLPIAVLLVLCAPAILAAEPPAAMPPVGDSTRAWLDLQAGGSAAAPGDRPTAGEVADKVYQRYVDSFARPIPDHFPRDSAASDSK